MHIHSPAPKGISTKSLSVIHNMNMKFQVALSILAVLALSSPAQSEGSRYCGRFLSETLVKYCQSTVGKRSDSLIRTHLFGTGYWLAPQLAMAMGRGKRHKGIASECCENSCTINELLAYCPED